MALSIVQKPLFTSTGSLTCAGTLATQPTAGNLLVAIGTFNGTLSGTGGNVTDSAGNTWTRIIQSFDGGNTSDTSIYYAKNIVTGASFTVTFHTGGTVNTNNTLTVYEIAGADTSAPWQASGGTTSNTGTSAAPALGPLTNSNASSIFIAAINNDDRGNPGTLTGPSGWSLDTSELNGATYGVCGCASLVVSSSAAQTATWGTANAAYTGVMTIFQAAVPPPVLVAVNDPNLFLSPYTWFVSGSTYAQTNNSGAYLRLWFSGSGAVALSVDTSVLAGAASGNYPILEWSLDYGAFQSAQLTSGQTSVALGTVSAGSHTLFLYVKNFSTSIDRWNFTAAPYSAVRVTNVSLPNGSTVSAMQPRSKRLLTFGDSITEGNAVAAGVQDAFLTYSFRLAEALGAEVGVVAFISQGWQVAGAGNVPDFYTSGNDTASSWNKYWSGQSRLSGGLLSPAPDYALVLHGTNDALQSVSDATVTTQATAFLAALRTAAGGSCKIVLGVPPGRFKRSALGAATLPDARVKFIDLGQEQATGLTNTPAGNGTAAGAAGWKSSDGLHPYQLGHGQIGARLAQAIQQAFTAQRVGMGGGANG